MEPLPSIHLHIERLVLDGVPLTAAEAERLQAGLAAELLRLFTEAPAAGAPQSQHLRSLPIASVEFDRENHAAFGENLASTLHQSLAPVLGAAPRPIAS
jgi:hypothetical protein